MRSRPLELPKTVVSPDGKQKGTPTGATRRCRLAGCNGLCIAVRWPDGRLTWPCSKGVRMNRRSWRIRL